MTNKKTSILAGIDAKASNLAQLIEYSGDSVVSKTLLDKPVGSITLFAFDQGQRLSTHSAPFDAVVQIVDGEALITIDENEHIVGAGEIIIMPADIPHALYANKKFKMLLTMIKSKN